MTVSPSHHLSLLPSLLQNLSQTLTCCICLDLMPRVKQLQCGHLFCHICVPRILQMPHVRCPMCKTPTGKRKVRDAPLDFAPLVAALTALRQIAARPTAERASVEQVLKLDKLVRSIKPPSGSKELPKKSKPVPVASRKCMLCPKNLPPQSFIRLSTTPIDYGKLLPVSSSAAHFAHENCALYAQAVYQVDQAFENVQSVFSTTKTLVCTRESCGRKHPQIACAHPSCAAHYHYPCAVVAGCRMIEDGYKTYCPSHKHEAPVVGEHEIRENLADPDGQVALKHDNLCFLCRSGGNLLMCDTCPRCVHTACVGLTAVPLADWSCSVCVPVQPTLPITPTPTCNTALYTPSSGLQTPNTSARKRKRMSNSLSISPSANATQSKKRRLFPDSRDKRYVLSHTGLPEEEREMLRTVCKARRTTLKSDIDPRVTHLIIHSRSTEHTPKRTMKLCKAIAAGVKIVVWKWIQCSMEVDTWPEIESHIHPLTWTKENPVFHGLTFCFRGYAGAMKNDLISLLQLGGGVVKKERESQKEPILFVRDEARKKSTRDRRDSISRFEPPQGTQVVTSAWILDKCTVNRSD